MSVSYEAEVRMEGGFLGSVEGSPPFQCLSPCGTVAPFVEGVHVGPLQ